MALESGEYRLLEGGESGITLRDKASRTGKNEDGTDWTTDKVRLVFLGGQADVTVKDKATFARLNIGDRFSRVVIPMLPGKEGKLFAGEPQFLPLK